MSGIHEAFKGYVPYQFTTLKVGAHAQIPEIKLLSWDLRSHLITFDSLQELRDPLDQIVSTQTAEDSKDEEKKTHPDK